MKIKSTRVVHGLFVILGTIALGVFSIGTLLYNLPSDPLRSEIGPVLQSMDPWLTQNWRFFAPDPPTTDEGLLVRYSQAGKRDETLPFVDVSTPGLMSVKHTFLPNREYRILSSSLDDLLSTEDALLAEANTSEASTVAEIDDKVQAALLSTSVSQTTKSRYFRSRLTLIRAVHHFFDKTHHHSSGPGDAAAIQIRIVEYQYPRFEERHRASTNDFHIRTLPWWDVE